MEIRPNDVVRITDGPFVDFTGEVVETHEDLGTVKVMIDTIGRPTPLELKIGQFEKLSK